MLRVDNFGRHEQILMHHTWRLVLRCIFSNYATLYPSCDILPWHRLAAALGIISSSTTYSSSSSQAPFQRHLCPGGWRLTFDHLCNYDPHAPCKTTCTINGPRPHKSTSVIFTISWRGRDQWVVGRRNERGNDRTKALCIG